MHASGVPDPVPLKGLILSVEPLSAKITRSSHTDGP